MEGAQPKNRINASSINQMDFKSQLENYIKDLQTQKDSEWYIIGEDIKEGPYNSFCLYNKLYQIYFECFSKQKKVPNYILNDKKTSIFKTMDDCFRELDKKYGDLLQNILRSGNPSILRTINMYNSSPQFFFGMKYMYNLIYNNDYNNRIANQMMRNNNLMNNNIGMNQQILINNNNNHNMVNNQALNNNQVNINHNENINLNNINENNSINNQINDKKEDDIIDFIDNYKNENKEN